MKWSKIRHGFQPQWDTVRWQWRHLSKTESYILISIIYIRVFHPQSFDCLPINKSDPHKICWRDGIDLMESSTLGVKFEGSPFSKCTIQWSCTGLKRRAHKSVKSFVSFNNNDTVLSSALFLNHAALKYYSSFVVSQNSKTLVECSTIELLPKIVIASYSCWMFVLKSVEWFLFSSVNYESFYVWQVSDNVRAYSWVKTWFLDVADKSRSAIQTSAGWPDDWQDKNVVNR